VYGTTTKDQEQMWSEYRNRLLRFILKRVSDPAAAEDLVQEILARAYSHLDELRDREKLLPWMYQTTRNAIVDYYRRRKPTEKFDESIALQDRRSDAAEKELAGCVTPFIQQLPVAYRQAVMLAEIKGVTQHEVAARQGISLSGAKSRVQRGRQMLKTMFLECCTIERDRRGAVAEFTAKNSCRNC
jgi:RNA polymerase sigma-70 factor (ECF subfamily)